MSVQSRRVFLKPHAFVLFAPSTQDAALNETPRPPLPFRATFSVSAYSGEIFYGEREMRAINPRLTAFSGPSLFKPAVPAVQLLNWALVLRSFLQAAEARQTG